EQESCETWEAFFSRRLPLADRCIAKNVPNRGRDTLPWVVSFRREILAHYLFLHLHTKRSAYSDALADWRPFLLHHTLGSTGVVSDILSLFDGSPQTGLIYPPYFSALKDQPAWGANKGAVSRLLSRLGAGAVPDTCPDF